MSPVLPGLPLRVRLVAGLVLLVAVGLLVAGLAATSELRSYQLDRVDAQLLEALDTPGLRGDRPGNGPGGRGGPGRLRGERDRLPGERYVAILDVRGTVLQADITAAGPALIGLTIEQVRARGRRPFTVEAVGGDGSWRVVAAALPSNRGSAVVATDLSEAERTVRRLAALQTVIGVLVLLGVSGLGYVVVRSSLRGLVDIEAAAAAVAAGDLARRLPVPQKRTEIGSLATSFNAMVTQVQSAFARRAESEDRLRQFVADASHELRTPLTSIRGFAELHRQGAVTEPDEVSRLLRRIEDEATRMGLLVEDLLALARLDEQRPLELVDVDLTVVATDAIHDARAVDPDRPITLRVEGTAPVVRGDDGRLRQVLANLLGNALQHTPVGTPVHVRLCATDDTVLVEVVDQGPGMSAEVAARVFERFYRADASRTRASGGSGLGLSIVAGLVRAHGGRVELDTAAGSGACFRILLPVAGPAS